MAPPSRLSPDFVRWATPKVYALTRARQRDGQLGTTYPLFDDCLQRIMVQYGYQPFGQPNFPGQDDLRPAAWRYCVNHARSLHHTLARAADVADVAGSALELWASAKQAHIHAQTCRALDIPVTTPDTQLPPDYIGLRKVVTYGEFRKVNDDDRDVWYGLAHALKRAMECENSG
ncbi:hypothetical protein AURDEDRAFT_130018 [Auricularia subglabra TFB-10046 SS5]|uniref:Uncharacterized protein n=1 Tax=Auricularia subglabra (strain TFB-10046 / SS5) TaxID=717982 RepID=J0CYS4_AURST|nr:hypothetical protein AURDEDRAFT_130018 [Auricularia subglabra TFB-10046 SS5]